MQHYHMSQQYNNNENKEIKSYLSNSQLSRTTSFMNIFNKQLLNSFKKSPSGFFQTEQESETKTNVQVPKVSIKNSKNIRYSTYRSLRNKKSLIESHLHNDDTLSNLLTDEQVKKLLIDYGSSVEM